MSKRLQVLLDETELRDIKRVARAQRLSVAAWVRQTLRAARTGAQSDTRDKLAAIRTAARHQFPTAEVDEMLAQIEHGYMSEARS
ncbi:MAG: antitoxin [Candidatus Limnocylindria bacterium]